MKSQSKKIIWVTIITCAALALISVVFYRMRHQSLFPIIDSIKLVEIKKQILASYPTVLSPDGSKVFDSMISYYLLQDGQIQDNTAAFEAGAPGASTFLSISPNGRFLTAADNLAAKNYLLDNEQKTYREDAFVCKSWSSDSSRCIDIHGNLVDIAANQKIENWDNNLDFRNVKNVSGNGDYLWDNDSNIPIARISSCPIRNDQTGEILETWCQLVTPAVRSLDQRSQGVVQNLVEISLPSSVVGWTFDPTGKYVLLAVWDRKPIPYTKYEELISSENILDTRLLLVNWRTKKTIELGHLSQWIPEYPKSAMGVQWSADGNTILVPLYHGSDHLVVLKMRYP